jgi:hypothetical protein
MPKLLEKKKKCKGENGKGKRISEKAPLLGFQGGYLYCCH